MLETLLIFSIGLLPPLLSLWAMRSAEVQAQTRLRAAVAAAERRGLQQLRLPPGDRYYSEGLGYPIGDISCQFNARSPYIRCAVNPAGPCQDCSHYCSIQLD